eukprot:scaffold10651_cov112-Isochrysis_galbana.AAC.1
MGGGDEHSHVTRDEPQPWLWPQRTDQPTKRRHRLRRLQNARATAPLHTGSKDLGQQARCPIAIARVHPVREWHRRSAERTRGPSRPCALTPRDNAQLTEDVVAGVEHLHKGGGRGGKGR